MYPTILEINTDNLLKNITFFKSKLYEKTKILAVVKAFAYGSDAVLISKILQKNAINYLAVAYTNEGVLLKKNNIVLPIIVLHAQIESYKKIIKHKLEPNIYSLNGLKKFIQIAKRKKLKNYPIHLKFNTGLNRLGFVKEDISDILKLVKNNSNISIKSIFSHLAASEDSAEREFTIKQINLFESIKNSFTKTLKNKPYYHILNTSGVLNYPEYQMDMVRIGIGMFGFANEPKFTKELKNVFRLKTKISQIHTINKGESLGYNRAFIATKKTKTATLPIGHADGISRILGNKNNFVYINHKKAFIIGNVCMDMIMVDVTNITCKEGDEVIIFDSQKDILRISKKLKTIPYEFLTMLSQRIKRQII